MMLHHFVLFNPAQTGIGCPISEPFLGAGNERTHTAPADAVRLHEHGRELEHDHVHVVNKSATPRTVNVEIIFRWRPLSETARHPAAVAGHRLDLQRRELRVHDPSRATPTRT